MILAEVVGKGVIANVGNALAIGVEVVGTVTIVGVGDELLTGVTCLGEDPHAASKRINTPPMKFLEEFMCFSFGVAEIILFESGILPNYNL